MLSTLGEQERMLVDERVELNLPRRKRRRMNRLFRVLAGGAVWLSSLGLPSYADGPERQVTVSDVRQDAGFLETYRFMEEQKQYQIRVDGTVYHAYPLVNKTVSGDTQEAANARYTWLITDGEGNVVRDRAVYKKAAFTAHMARAADGQLPEMLTEYEERLWIAANETTRVYKFVCFAGEAMTFLTALAVSQGKAAHDVATKAAAAGAEHAREEVEKEGTKFAQDVLSQAFRGALGQAVEIFKGFTEERGRVNTDREFHEDMMEKLKSAHAAAEWAAYHAPLLNRSGVASYHDAVALGENIVTALSRGQEASVGLVQVYGDWQWLAYHGVVKNIATGVVPWYVTVVQDFDTYVSFHEPKLAKAREERDSMRAFAEQNYTTRAVRYATQVLQDAREVEPQETVQEVTVNGYPLSVNLGERRGEVFGVLEGNVDNDPAKEVVIAMNTYDPDDDSWITRWKPLVIIAEPNGVGYDIQQMFYPGMNDERYETRQRSGNMFQKYPVHPAANCNAFRLVDLDADGTDELSIIMRLDKPPGIEYSRIGKPCSGFVEFCLYRNENGRLERGPFLWRPLLGDERPETQMVVYQDLNNDGRMDVIELDTQKGYITFENTGNGFVFTRPPNKYESVIKTYYPQR